MRWYLSLSIRRSGGEWDGSRDNRGIEFEARDFRQDQDIPAELQRPARHGMVCNLSGLALFRALLSGMFAGLSFCCQYGFPSCQSVMMFPQRFRGRAPSTLPCYERVRCEPSSCSCSWSRWISARCWSVFGFEIALSLSHYCRSNTASILKLFRCWVSV